MKKLLICLVLSFVVQVSYAQDNAWDLPCLTTAESTAEMTDCTAKARAIIDSVLTAEYAGIKAEFTAELARVDSSSQEYIDGLIQKIALIEQSEVDFRKSVDALSHIAYIENEGGSMRFLATNMTVISLFEKQLEILSILKKEWFL